MAVTILIKELLEAGAHFGHKCSRWDPRMRRFIFEKRNGIYIIDLQKTAQQIQLACNFIRSCVLRGKSILVVGTKKQAKEIVKEVASRCGLFWVTERWLGGTLTNLETIHKSVTRFKNLLQMEEDGNLALYSKKEAASLRRELAKLRKNLEGIKDLNKLPGAIFIIDPDREKIAVHEANKLSIPVIALVDTNGNPELIDYPIACNDDAIRTIGLILSKLEETVVEARGEIKEEPILKEEEPVLKEEEPEEADASAVVVDEGES